MAIDSIGWSNFGSQVAFEHWNWKQYGKVFTIKLVLHFIAVVRGAFDDEHFDYMALGVIA